MLSASRPYMPGYGVLGPEAGDGLLPWSWAGERLLASHDYWVATRWPDGRPHLMPVWGVWLDGAVWFGSSLRSRKARNLLADPRCSVSTSNAQQPVIVEGRVERLRDRASLQRFIDAMNGKYNSGMDLAFVDPAKNATFRVAPERVFALDESQFATTPTRWVFTP